VGSDLYFSHFKLPEKQDKTKDALEIHTQCQFNCTAQDNH